MRRGSCSSSGGLLQIAAMNRAALSLTVIALWFSATVTAIASDPLRVAITPNKPTNLTTRTWPISVGIPFKKGEYRDEKELTIVDEAGKPVPCQIVKTADWEDGSLRWVLADFNAQLDRKYFLTKGARAEAKDDIQIEQNSNGLNIHTGNARYTFPTGAATFDSLRLDLNHDGKFDENETLVGGAAGAFHVVDSQRKRSVLRAGKTTVELAGNRYTVVRTEGDYFSDDGKRRASGVIYFHFYASYPAVRISHKLIVTEDTNELWFRDIGLHIPMNLRDRAEANFNSDHANPKATFSYKLRGDDEVSMAQYDFPHFGSTNNLFVIAEGRKGALQSGTRCGDWADVSSSRWGLAAQLPGFAEQFPTLFRMSAIYFDIKLWTGASAKELDFRTPQIIKNYFGHDWIPETNEVTKVANTAAGTAKTHNIWLYPHVGPLTPELISQFGATKEEIYASVDPAWIARSGVMGLMHPKDTKNFPEAEEVISDYFDRSTLAGHRVFPATGYLYWGMYPYSAQPWKLKDGRWYPTVHRLSRTLEYNLKRGMWHLYARSGERKYFDYARKYTRFLRDFIFSNCDAPMKPKGWIVMGSYHTPIVWGSFSEEAIKAGKAGRKPSPLSEASFLSAASSEDVIQFVYDYFLTGDLHSRDMARAYTEAIIKEFDFDTEKILLGGGGRCEAFIRMLGSAYDLDHDPRLRDLGNRLMQRMVLPDGQVNPEIPTQYGKWGEIFGAYYYHWISTGDPLARKALVKLAKFVYRRGELDGFFARSSPQFQMFALAYQDTGDPTYAAYLAQAVNNFSRDWPTMKKLGVKLDDLNQLYSKPWGQDTMTGQGPVNIGVPAAEAVLANYKGPRPYLPFAVKPYPTEKTHLVFRKGNGPATLDLYVNNWGDRSVEPQLFDLKGKKLKLDIVEREAYRATDQPPSTRSTTYDPWYLRYEEHCFFKLRVPESVPAGVYRLDAGDAVAFTVLYADIEQMVQVAPDGLVLREGDRYFFQIPSGTTQVEYFAMQPVKIYDPSDKEVAVEDLKNGNYRFATGGQAGGWVMVRPDRIPPFVKLKNIPFVMALGDPKRLFEFDASAVSSGAPTNLPDPTDPFLAGKFGKAAQWLDQFVQLKGGSNDVANALKDLPRERGTVEFWFRPGWSATDNDFAHSTFRMQLFRANPVSLAYSVDTNPGGSGVYNQAYFALQVHDAGFSRAQVYLQRGRWYHVAVTWNVDGANSECNIFLNGRKRDFFHYTDGMDRNVPPTKLLPAESLRFGSGHQYGYIRTSELFDELRVSRVVRYRDDFELPSAPFQPDKDTALLMHLDGNYDAIGGGATVPAELVKGSKLW